MRVAVLNSPDVWSGDRWPPPPSSVAAWYLHSGGRANGRGGDGGLVLDGPRTGTPDHLVYDHADPVPAVGGDDCGDPDVVAMGPADQASVEQRLDVLVYTSTPAAEETVILGQAQVVLFVQSSEPVCQWLVRLCLVTDMGLSVNIAETVTRCAAPAGEPRELHLGIGPVAFRVRPGERVRLHVTQGSTPRWSGLRDLQGRLAVGRAVVLHGPDHPSRVLLPVTG